MGYLDSVSRIVEQESSVIGGEMIGWKPDGKSAHLLHRQPKELVIHYWLTTIGVLVGVNKYKTLVWAQH